MTAHPVCDCGYLARGETDDERADDAARHAREVHGIEVSPEQVLAVAADVGAAMHEDPSK